MLPAGLTVKAMQLCAAALGAAGSQAPTTGPTTSCVTPASVFHPCALAHVENGASAAPITGVASVSTVAALVQRAFGARVTDTVRPMNATYGARYSWHKFGQAVDFVPAGGVGSITRDQIRALMAASGIRLLELLGPGDRGHSNHWHIAFARPGQLIERVHPVEADEDWIIDVASAGTHATRLAAMGTDAPLAPASVPQPAGKRPPQWDVFAVAEWRATHGGGS